MRNVLLEGHDADSCVQKRITQNEPRNSKLSANHSPGTGLCFDTVFDSKNYNNDFLHHNNDLQLDQFPEGRRTLFPERDQSAYVQASFLPKLKLGEFSGDPIDWPEWSSLFQPTIGSSHLSNDDKLAHLRTKLVGSAKRALQGVDILVQCMTLLGRHSRRSLGTSISLSQHS